MKIALLSTGGTIATTEYNGETRPRLTAQDFISEVPELGELAGVKAVDLFTKPSTHITPSNMYKIVQKLEELDQDPTIDATIVTHGTDTLEETSYFVDLCYDGTTPVLLTGAMRKSTDTGSDGPANLLAAARFAREVDGSEFGPLVVMADQAFAARDVTKHHANTVAAFTAPGHGPVGTLVEDRPQIGYRPNRRDQYFSPEPGQLSTDIVILTASVSMSDRLPHAAKDADGIIIAGTGGGRVPPTVTSALRAVGDQGTPIVMTTRSPVGYPSFATYDFEGGGNTLREIGVLFSDLLPWKARLKLTVAEASNNSLESTFTDPSM